MKFRLLRFEVDNPIHKVEMSFPKMLYNVLRMLLSGVLPSEYFINS